MEINFFCVHKQLRSKRMGPVLIKEITRRANLKSIFQAVYTSGTVLPGMIGKCRYWHRSLNVKKLVDINFSYLSPLVTLQRSIRLHRLPEKTQTKGFRAMRDEDIPQAHKLLAEHLKRFAISPVFTLDEFKHHFISRPEIVSSFVVAEPNGKISDFSSFYHLSSSVLQHPNYNKLNAAYSFYTVAKQTPLVDLMRDLLITAKEMGFDVFNALDSMDNRTFLEELKFGMGDGDLHYYLYNWQTGFMQSNEIGLTLL
ncbi:hypothetical protein GJ496_002522 [Pomphorhynchus laevis]|nr:hypothetical protein GJ496_002522 [Pomphorhynchus laevis]